MTEPKYEYVKGQGWVVSNNALGPIITMRGGKRVRMEFRKPLPGEHYDHGIKSIYGTTDNPVVKEWLKIYDNSEWAYETMPVKHNHDTYNDGCYVVMVPV